MEDLLCNPLIRYFIDCICIYLFIYSIVMYILYFNIIITYIFERYMIDYWKVNMSPTLYNVYFYYWKYTTFAGTREARVKGLSV